MLLTMGVRDCPEQVEVYSKVFEVAKSMWVVWVVKDRLPGRMGELGG